MSDDPETKQQGPTPEEEGSRTGLSRRGFLNRLKIAGLGFGAVVVLGARDVDARDAPAADIAPTGPAGEDAAAKQEQAQLVEAAAEEVDPDDPRTHFAQYWRRRRRRYWRRRRRWGRRYWRRGRRWRRRYWRRRRWRRW